MKVSVAPDFESLLPALSDAELAQLEQNCLDDPKHETMPPVILWGNHKNTIVDGHNQNRIRTKNNLKIKYQQRDFDTRDEAKRFALDVQFGRRNLDASQRAIAYAKLPRNSHGGERKADQVANLPLDKLAESAGVSKRTMQDAAKVVDNAPAAIVKAVQAGDVKVSDAAAIAELPKAEQTAALKAVKQGKAKTLRAATAEPAEETKAERGWGEGDSLDNVQADLKELARRCKELSKFARTILRCEENDPTRPYCCNYSLLTLSHPLLHIARVVANDLPVGGTPKKPILYHEEKAASLAK